MSNRPKSVYLTERSMSAVRPSDSLSGRMNQILDRYLEMVRADGKRVRAMFGTAAWGVLTEWRRQHTELSAPSVGLRVALENALDADWPHGGVESMAVARMTAGELVVLLELLEADAPTR